MVLGFIGLFAPLCPQQRAQQIAQQVFLEQTGLGGVINDCADPQARAKYPQFGVRIIAPGGGVGVISTPKIPAGDLQSTTHHATVLALALAPPARAVLLALGYKVEFFQSPAQPASRIIVPT
jgi:hypothetical protein